MLFTIAIVPPVDRGDPTRIYVLTLPGLCVVTDDPEDSGGIVMAAIRAEISHLRAQGKPLPPSQTIEDWWNEVKPAARVTFVELELDIDQ